MRRFRSVPARMKPFIEKYLEYLRSVRNSSPHTILNYGKDLEQFLAYLSPPGAVPPALTAVTHTLIREFVAHLHEQGLEKSSIARKLAAIRSFFKYCVREGWLRESPARLVPTPKLPKRIPSVLSAEEMNDFLNHLASLGPKSQAKGARVQKILPAERRSRVLVGATTRACSSAGTALSSNSFTPPGFASANSPA